MRLKPPPPPPPPPESYTVTRERGCLVIRTQNAEIPDVDLTALVKAWKTAGVGERIDFLLSRHTAALVVGNPDALNAWRNELGLATIPTTPSHPEQP